MMSRAKSRQNLEVCGDCGAGDAAWASVNRGILLCTQCCSIHRSLGRHVSQVKHLLKSTWHPNQFNMVCALNNNGANNIWEHALLENNGKMMKKKPSPKDPMDVKREYIKAKHLQCLYAFREHYEDGLLCVENELGKQLHASVRTGNLETSFRLIVLGADPNYFHNEKGTTPLHVAVKSDQKLQIELLLVYGADPSYPDSQGKTPIDYASQSGNKEILSRLIECQYEITDTLSYYLCLRRPDHHTGVHFLIPQAGIKSDPASLAKLQRLSNHVFEELVKDVFDEVERRETEAIWLSCADTTDLTTVPFLPVDNNFSTTRNQGRQKLARFSTPELKSLVYDILVDIQRRQKQLQKAKLRSISEIIDDDPLYDSVASDEDYAQVPDIEETQDEKSPEKPPDNRTTTKIDSSIQCSPSEISLDKSTPITMESYAQTSGIELVYIEALNNTNRMLDQLTKQLKNCNNTIVDLRTEVLQLKQCIKNLENENFELKCRLAQRFGRLNGDSGFESSEYIPEQHHTLEKPVNGLDEVDLRKNSRTQRPSSMYETREGIARLTNWQALKNQLRQSEQARNTTQSLCASPEDREVVLQCTEQITRTIQALCKSIQEPEMEECVTCAEKVKLSIARLASTLPKQSESERMKLMLEVASRLVPECEALQLSRKKNDSKTVETHFGNIRDIALHLAKFTKDVVTRYSSNP